MDSQNALQHYKGWKGWMEIYFGGMFAGKTEKLNDINKRAKFANLKTLAFKPAIDNRYSETKIVSNDNNTLDCETIIVKSSDEILDKVPDSVDIVFIDEIQFFDQGIVGISRAIARRGKRVVAAGLDQKFNGEPFPVTAAYVCEAELPFKVRAICVNCGNESSRSHRKTQATSDIEIGGKAFYEPLCDECFVKTL